MRRYNLNDEKWIPVRMLDGIHDALSITDTLLKAKEIAAIEDPSPLVVISIYRFLLALLYRALEGPHDIEQAEILFRDGLPNEKIKTYLSKWRDRFWLFDERYPFGQVPSYNPKTWKPWTTLTAEHNADNAKVLFDHTNVLLPGKISEAKAVCAILATQTFALGGGNSDFLYTSNAPSATAVMVLPIGKNLEKTLLFSLVPANREMSKEDLPIWEQEPVSNAILKSNCERIANGFAGLYTWRSRAIRLKESCDGIENVGFASGMKHGKSNLIDPMLAYRNDKKFGLLPKQFGEKGLWRSFDSLLPSPIDSTLAPKVVEHALQLAGLNPQWRPQSIMAFGQSSNKAKVEFWRMERFILPEALRNEKCIRSDIRRFLDVAEEAGKTLKWTCKIFALHSLSRGDRKPDSEDIDDFVQQMIAIPLYWSDMEAHFHKLLNAFSSEKDADDIENFWLVAVKNTLMKAWNLYKSSIPLNNAWTIKAMIQADSFLSANKMKKELTNKIKEYEFRRMDE